MTEIPQKMVPFDANRAIASLFFKRLMELLPDHVYFKDGEGRFMAISRAQGEFFGLSSPDEAVGKSDYDFFPLELAQLKDSDEREIVRTGVGFIDKEERSDSVNNLRWTLSTKLPLIGDDGKVMGTFGISRDITEQKQTREALQEHHRLLETLIEILPCRIFVKDREGRIQVCNGAYRQALGLHNAQEIQGLRIDEIIKDERAGQIALDDRQIIESGISILNREEVDAWPVPGESWSLLSKVPLIGGDGSIQGIVGMSADISLQKQAIAIAVQAQRDLEVKSHQMESELMLAREMQTELMSASVQNVKESIDLSAPFAPCLSFVYEPCAHLAGDFFQAVPLGRQKFGLLVCDVMGHGVKAALVTTLMRGLLAELTARDLKPSHVLGALNDRLCSLLDRPAFPRFVTALYATIDISTGHLIVANAGHPWPLWMDKESGPEPLSFEESGPALGLIPNSLYLAEERLMTRGTRLLLYTDGLKEEHNDLGEEFGEQGIVSIIQRNSTATPQHTLEDLLQAVRRFSGNTFSGDDLCAVMAQF